VNLHVSPHANAKIVGFVGIKQIDKSGDSIWGLDKLDTNAWLIAVADGSAPSMTWWRACGLTTGEC
jgi:hypothetical protein